nr:UBP1-associated protein 2C-like [Tanacetum cinerariifolium]
MNPSENNTKKRKLDQNDAVSPDDIRKVLAPLTPQQLSEIIVTASFLHPDVSRIVRALADNDVTQRHLYVRSLDPKTTSASLRSVFAAFGELEEAEVAVNKKGKSRGYGHVTFRNAGSAMLALQEPVKVVDGRMTVSALNVDRGRVAGKGGSMSRVVFVSDVPDGISAEVLLGHFREYGEIERGPVRKRNGLVVFMYRSVEGARAALVKCVKKIDGYLLRCTRGNGDDDYDDVAEDSDGGEGAVKVNGVKGTEACRVYIGNLPKDMTKERLLEHFKEYGEVKTGPFPTDKDTGKFTKNFCFIVYENVEGADACLVDPKKNIDGHWLYCDRDNENKKAKPKEVDGPKREVQSSRIYIGNVPYDITKDELFEYFSKYGEVADGPFPFDKRTGKFRGFAFIVYKSVEGANACLADSKKSINGRRLYCSRDNRDIDGKKGKPSEVAGPKPMIPEAGELVKKICINNVPPNMSKETLLDHFLKYGEVKRGPFGTDKDTGKFLKGHAFIVYKDVESADACLVDPKKIIDGHELYCERETDKKVKEGKMVAPVQVRGSDDGVRPDALNLTHPNLRQGSCGSHLDSGGPSGVSAYGGILGGLGVTGKPGGISGYGGGGSPLRHSDHLLNMNFRYGSGLSPYGSAGGFGGSHLGDRGAIYGGMGSDPDASYDRTTGDREVRLGVSYGGHGASFDRTISDGEAWLRDRYAGRGASYDRTRSDGEVLLGDRYDGRGASYDRTTGDGEALLHDRYGGLGASYDRTTGDGEALLRDKYGGRGASYDRTTGDGEALLRDRYGGRGTSYDRTIGDGEAGLLGRYGGHAAIYDRTTGDGEALLGDRHGGRGSSYDRTTGDGDALLGDRYGDRGASYGGMGSSRGVGLGTSSGGSGHGSRYVMSPRSMRGLSGGYPESAHYSLSSGSTDQTQQQNKRYKYSI